MEELKESFENQLIYLYDEKMQFENKLGTSDPKDIVAKFKNLESELMHLYGIKDKFKKVSASQINVTNIKNVFIDKNRLKVN
jgi:hypothetical protein